jgi:hypothetical protein
VPRGICLPETTAEEGGRERESKTPQKDKRIRLDADKPAHRADKYILVGVFFLIAIIQANKLYILAVKTKN